MEDYFLDRLRPLEYRIWGYSRSGRPAGRRAQSRAAGTGAAAGLGRSARRRAGAPSDSRGDRDSEHGGVGLAARARSSVCDYFRVTLRIVPEALLTGSLRDLQLLYHSRSAAAAARSCCGRRHLESDALFLKRVIDIVISAALLDRCCCRCSLVIAIAIKLTHAASADVLPLARRSATRDAVHRLQVHDDGAGCRRRGRRSCSAATR